MAGMMKKAQEMQVKMAEMQESLHAITSPANPARASSRRPPPPRAT
jgi:DNA-binding protein YbaB